MPNKRGPCKRTEKETVLLRDTPWWAPEAGRPRQILVLLELSNGVEGVGVEVVESWAGRHLVVRVVGEGLSPATDPVAVELVPEVLLVALSAVPLAARLALAPV